MTPIGLLKAELATLERDAYQSAAAYKSGRITLSEHEGHLKRIQPKIDQYKKAIAVLAANNFVEAITEK